MKICRKIIFLILTFRVFAGTDIYRSLTPLNMDSHSSEDSAFNTIPKDDENDPDSTIPNPSTSTNGRTGNVGYEEEVFGSAVPRGPFAALMTGSNGATSVETSLDMIKISLKDSSGEYTTNSLNEDHYGGNVHANTTTTILSHKIQHNKSTDDVNVTENVDECEDVKDVQIKHDKTSLEDNDDDTSVDRTIIDSELPSLPTDNVGLIDESSNDLSYDDQPKTHKIQSASSFEQKDVEAGPVSLSDIKLEEISQ